MTAGSPGSGPSSRRSPSGNAARMRSAKRMLAAEAASRAKDRFLAMLSHELRTPLTPVLAEVSAMLDDPETPAEIRPVAGVDPAQHRAGSAADRRPPGRHPDRPGEAGAESRAVDAHVLIHRTLEICRGDVEAAGLELAVDLRAASAFVDADPPRLQQVFWNLFKNAVKFTPRGGTGRRPLAERGRTATAWSSRSRTRGSGSIRRSCRGSSTPSSRAARRSRGDSAASASAWRSVGAWSPCTAAGCRPGATAEARAPHSSSSSTPSPPRPTATSRTATDATARTVGRSASSWSRTTRRRSR